MRLPWFKLVIVLVAIWAVVGGIIFWARSAKPTPEAVMRYLEEHPRVPVKGAEIAESA